MEPITPVVAPEPFKLTPTRRNRRSRRFPESHFRAKLATWLRVLAEKLNPLPKDPREAP